MTTQRSLLPRAARLPIACAALLLSTACVTPGPTKQPGTQDVVRGVLSGLSVGGVDLGAASGVAMNTYEASREIPQDEEVLMGRDVAAALLGAAPLVRNPEQQRYVNRIGRWLAVHSGRADLPWRFGIIDTPGVNAFATPGGHVFVTRGLVERVRSESELAGILAHEIAHVVQKHHLNDIRKAAGKNLALDLASLKSGGLAGEAGRALARVGLEGFVRGLSREDELEADRIGIVIAARAGYEPYGLPAVLQTLAAMPQDDSAMALFLKTHPTPLDRLAVLEALVPVGWEAYAKPNAALGRFDQVFIAGGPPPGAASGTPAATPVRPAAPKPKPPAAKPPVKPAT